MTKGGFFSTKNQLGKRSPDGRLREYAYTWEIALRVNTELNAHGFSYSLLIPNQ